MQITEMERSVLDMYHAGEGKCTIADIARELDISENEASKHSSTLKDLGLLEGERLRKITENGLAILEGREPPLEQPPTVVEPDPGTATDAPRKEPRVISEILGEQYGIKPGELFNIVARNVIQTGRNEETATAAEVYHVLNVMREYDLNPWMKEVHAFRHKGKLQVMLGYDGWVKKAIRYPGWRGATYEYGPMVDSPDGKGKKCHEWVECTVMSAGRVPTTIRAYLDEWYVPKSQNAREDGPWQKYTRTRLRQKAFCLAVREHCGISLWDESDREQMEYYTTTAEVVSDKTATAQIEIGEQLARDAAAAEAEAENLEAMGILDPEKEIAAAAEGASNE